MPDTKPGYTGFQASAGVPTLGNPFGREGSGRTGSTERINTMEARKMQVEVQELEERIAPSITLLNPGGNTPGSENAANGAPDFENPAGHAPPGQNK